MSNPYFRFKRFTIFHDRCAMKVGTDGVLLGAWCPVDGVHRVLDIGTGSGLIAIMAAQRISSHTDDFHIDAIDIDESAALQASDNCAQSPWADHFSVTHTSLREACCLTPPYDLIVSNPPYFRNSLKNPDPSRLLARHTDSLSYEELIGTSARLLAAPSEALPSGGRMSLILPFEAKPELLGLAHDAGLHPVEWCEVHLGPTKPAGRLMITFQTAESSIPLRTTSLYLHTPDAAALTQDFYL